MYKIINIMHVKSFKSYIKSDYTTESIVGGGLPVFTYGGVNFGDGGSVRNHFGDKGDSTFNPKKTKQKTLGQSGFATDDDGVYMDQADLNDLILTYHTWCMLNDEEPIPTDILDAKTLSFIKNKMK